MTLQVPLKLKVDFEYADLIKIYEIIIYIII